MPERREHQDLHMQMVEHCLDLMEPDERARFDRKLAESEALRTEYARVAAELQRLAEDEIEIPVGLYEKIVDAVKRDFEEHKEPAARITSPLFALREVFAVAASIVVLVSAWAVTANYARQESRKIMCSSRLGELGVAVGAYANDFPQQLPYSPDSDLVWYDQRQAKPKRPHFFLLAKHGYAEPASFICPAKGVGDIPTARELAGLRDFPRTMPVTYSYQNVYGDGRLSEEESNRRWQQPSRMAIVADQTPLLRNGALVGRLDPNSPSPNHSGWVDRGQNMLSLDGAVHWRREPWLADPSDNIWQAGSLVNYTGTEQPAGSTDSFLAP